MLDHHIAAKNTGINAARLSEANASNDMDRFSARLSLIVAQSKPLGAFETEAREKARMDYNKSLNLGA